MRKITCKTVQSRLLEKWLDGGLDSETGKKVEEHVISCPECLKAKEELEGVGRLIRAALEHTAEARPPVSRPHPEAEAHPSRLRTAGWLRPAWIGLAACLAVALGLAIYYWPASQEGSMHAGPGTSENGDVEPAIPDSATPVTVVPVIALDSTVARPGETVLIALKATNLTGISGLKARVRFDPQLVRIEVRGSNLAQMGVQGNEVIIATVSADGWLSQEGVAFELPVTVREDVSPDTTVIFEILSVDATDKRKTPLTPELQGGEIRVL
jgi:hypothetical protein